MVVVRRGLDMDAVDACCIVLSSPEWRTAGQRGRIVLALHTSPCASPDAHRTLLKALRRDLMYASDVSFAVDDAVYIMPAYAVDGLIRGILAGD